MIGVVSTMPKRELLTSAPDGEGVVHAFYPTATRTLCNQPTPLNVKGWAVKPTCEACVTTARAWHRIDGCCPAHWHGLQVLEEAGAERLGPDSAASSSTSALGEVAAVGDLAVSGPALTESEPGRAAASPSARTGHGVAQAEILAMLADGPQRIKDIALRRHTAVASAYTTLTALIEKGAVARVDRGTYALVETAASVVPLPKPSGGGFTRHDSWSAALARARNTPRGRHDGGVRCCVRARAARRARRRGRMTEPKVCVVCGESFEKPERWSVAQWAKRVYCGKACQRQHQVERVIAGDWRLHSSGYRMLFCPRHPSAPSGGGHVYEHRIVMERTLGRLLASHEYVHHLNEDPLDNRPENLQVVRQSAHRVIHFGTPSDEAVAALIRQGNTSREIAALGVSTHRIVRVRRELVA